MPIDTRLPVVHGTGGRPAYSDKVRAKIIAGLKLGWTRTAAYGASGISESTFYDWMRDDHSFSEAVTAAEASAEGGYSTDLRRGARRGDMGAVKFWLERRRPKEWRESRQLVIAVETPEDRFDAELTEDELVEALARIRATGRTDFDPHRDDGARAPAEEGTPGS